MTRREASNQLVWTSFNTASGMRSHVTKIYYANADMYMSFNTASGMRSHVTSKLSSVVPEGAVVSIPQAV